MSIRHSPRTGEIVQVQLDAERTDLGQVLGLTDDDKLYIATFDDEALEVTEDIVSTVTVPPGKDGGFDVAIPANESMMDTFMQEVTGALAKQSFCVVQMRSTKRAREAARLSVENVPEWEALAPEFQRDYLGVQLEDKAKWFQPGEVIYEDLTAFDSALEMLAATLYHDGLGFLPAAKSNTLLRVAAADAQDMEAIVLASQENNVLDARVVEEQLAFLSRRRLALLSFVSGDEGLVELQPWNSVSREVIKVPVKENRVLIFRHDIFDYSRKSNPGDVALQTWILRAQRPDELSLDAPPASELQAVSYERPMPPEYGLTGEKVEVTSCATYHPCDIAMPEHSWCAFIGAGDGVSAIPLIRWDHSIYYSEENDPINFRSYANHGSLTDTFGMISFDADHFGYTMEEAAMIDPLQRKGIEIGYEALYRGGWTKASLQGAKMTVAMGTVNGEIFTGKMTGSCPGEINATFLKHASVMAASSRLGYLLGVNGPTYAVDTACSSSLTATAMLHSTLRPEEPGRPRSCAGTERVKSGMSMGLNGMFSPATIIGLALGNMLSHQGRCFTFDQSADGYLRAEGLAGMFVKVSSEPEGDPLRLSMLCGTSSNQDGKSASLTAPNGPSQQEAIRQSLREAQIPSLKIQIQELHGTGTALGDPIEVGALRAVMVEDKVDGVWRTREHPLVKTSSKSNIGHMEMNAGLCGLLKCVYMSCHACAVPNVHLRELNSHTDTNGYPVLFTSEMVEQGDPAGYFGVSSFGFSGCNARADIWGRALAGFKAESTKPLDVTSKRSKNPAREHALTLGREDMLLQGPYLTGNPMSEIDTLLIGGTFNGRKEFEEMYLVEDVDADVQGGPAQKWSYLIPIRETRVEYFRLFAPSLGEIFPQEQDASEESRILGPGTSPGHCQWRIDARDTSSVAPGSFYRILFWYDEATMSKRIAWEVATPAEVEEASEVKGEPFPVHHPTYCIAGTFTSDAPLKMQGVPGKKQSVDTAAWEYTIRIGLSGREDFQIWRDGDKNQAIYPSKPVPERGAAVQVRGPDSRAGGRKWRVRGETGEKVTITVEVVNGNIRLSLLSQSGDVQSFYSSRGNEGRSLAIMSAANDFEPHYMTFDPLQDCWRAEVPVRAHVEFNFVIAEDGDLAQAWFPDMPHAAAGVSQMHGPTPLRRDAVDSACWSVSPRSFFQEIEILFDPTCEDRRKAVSWNDFASKKMLPEIPPQSTAAGESVS